MRVIVIGFDSSEDSRRALGWASILADGQDDVELHLVHALGMPTLPGRTSAALLEHLLDEHEKEMLAALEHEAEPLRASGRAVRVMVRRWLPAETLVEHAAGVRADLLAVGTHGAGRARFLLGTVSGEVVREALEPVLVARGSRPPATPRRVLLCLDGSVHALRAARAAARWCPTASLLAVHVRRDEASLRATELADAVRALGLGERRIETLLDDGEPAARILDLVASGEFDLLSAGTRGLGPLADLLLGSVSDKLLQLAPCPVLIAR